jgi:hypothetical protein
MCVVGLPSWYSLSPNHINQLDLADYSKSVPKSKEGNRCTGKTAGIKALGGYALHSI